MGNNIKLMKNNACIDATIFTKDEAISGISKRFGIPLEEIAAISDEVGDIPFLKTPGLCFVGAPTNAQDRVKETLSSMENGYVSSLKVYEGFKDFYSRAEKKGAKLVISDRDGVLKEGSNMQWGEEFRKLALEMGQPSKPLVSVLTGSSYNQNLDFMKKYGLDERLRVNPEVEKHPHLLSVEGGAIHVNVLTGELVNYVAYINPGLLKVLKGEFERKVKERLEKEVLPALNLGWSKNYDDQTEKVYHIEDKLSMVSFNVPRKFKDGTPYRESPEAEQFRNMTIKIMEETAQKLNTPYEIL